MQLYHSHLGRGSCIVRLRLFFILFCLFSFTASALCADDVSRVLVLRGHLDKKLLQEAEADLAKKPKDAPLLIELSSSSGDLPAVFDLIKALYEWRLRNKQKVIVYIQDSALGPAALVPFLADEIETSVFVSWGDALLGTEPNEPTHVLRSRVRSIVLQSHPKAPLLRLIAEAMVDGDMEIIDDNGWRQRKEGETGVYNVISPKDERLVLGQVQMKDLGLVAEVESIADFRARYALSSVEVDSLKHSEEREEGLTVTPEDLLASLKEHIAFKTDAPNRIGHLIIDDKQNGINQSTWIYVKSALDYYKTNKPAFIILELNTPGGEVFSAQKISDALEEMDTTYGVPVVAYINNWAISAGAMLAYSCRYIAVVKDASMGAAEPVFAGQGGQMVEAPEKVNSALRIDFANRAGFFDRNPDIAEAMVDKDIILVIRHGQIQRLDVEGQVREEGPEKDEILSAGGKLLTLSAEDLIKYGVADIFLAPKQLEPISIEERERGKWPASKELLCQQTFFKGIPEGYVDSFRPDWRIRFLSILATPAVASFLFLGMMLGFYVEINTPGFGFPGSLALVCLGLILLSSFALDIVDWLEVVFLLVGVLLLALELFVIPGFGVAGITGLILFVVGLFAIMLPSVGSVTYDVDSQTLNAAGEVFVERLVWLCAALIVGTVSMFLLGRYVMPSLGAFSRLVLKEEQTGFSAIEGAPAIGTEGITDCDLRPAGRILVGDDFYSAMSDGVYIPKGKRVKVVRVEGYRVYVDPME
ncbi:MAG: serine protease [Chlamydiia bacterium]|nr:serine protease [Chlamydiia bacterium]